MVANCEDVWREVSNYLDDEVDPGLRVALDDHIRGCKRCEAVVEGTRNVIQLFGDDRMLEVPLGFSERLHARLDANMPGNRSRRRFFGWMAAAAACLVVGSIEAVRTSKFSSSPLRSEKAQPGYRVPPDMMVVVSDHGKSFHAAACPLIQEQAKLRTITAAEASREGYTPCVRCMKQYLVAS